MNQGVAMTQTSGHRKHAPSGDDLVEELADLARSLDEMDGSASTLDRIVEAALTMIPGAQEGSVNLVAARRRVTSAAASGELPRLADALQTEVGEGSCLDAIFQHRTVSVPDMVTERRWPAFATRAAHLGAGSMLAFQLYVSGDNLGALNLHAGHPDAFTDQSERIGIPFAVHAAVALSTVRRSERQQEAMASRNAIGQAQGILMERHRITAAQAFDRLTAASQATNVKLRDVAEELARSGHLAGPAGRP